MAQHTLKRSYDDVDSNNDDLNDENDVTWGGKRPRYIYNYTLQPDLLSNSNDTDETESANSYQTKTTATIESEKDLPSVSTCESECTCDNENQEFEVRSSSDETFNVAITSTDSSSTFDYEVTDNNIVCDVVVPSDNDGYLPDDTDIQTTFPKTNIPPPACFKFCLRCREENPNPYFQYCYTCFQIRMEFFENKPNPKPKKTKDLNTPHHQTERSSQNPSLSNSNISSPVGISSVNLFQKQNKDSKENIAAHSHTSEIHGDIQNICNICFTLPKNGVFNHGKIGHIYCCYPCAKEWRKKSNKCPICNVKIKFITKIIVV